MPYQMPRCRCGHKVLSTDMPCSYCIVAFLPLRYLQLTQPVRLTRCGMNHSEGSTEEQMEVRASSPPYISYLTFRNFMQWLETDGIPLRFDRSAWSKKFSGSTGPQLLNGLRFLNLLRGDAPTADLERIVEARGEERKKLLQEVFRNAYHAIRFEELSRATPGMLREWIEAFGVSGDTARKAESFFVNVAKDLDIHVSSGLRKTARNRPPLGTTRTARAPTKVKTRQPSSGETSKLEPQTTAPSAQSISASYEGADAQSSLILWGLFKKLPPPGEVFSKDDREAWIEAMRTLFNLEYRDE